MSNTSKAKKRTKEDAQSADYSDELSADALLIVQRFLIAVEQNDVASATAAVKESRALVEFSTKRVDLVKVADDKGLSPLIVASALGHLEMVKGLIELGASPYDLSVNGNTALMLASCYGRLTVVEFFCEFSKSLKDRPKSNISENNNKDHGQGEVGLVDMVNEVGQSALMFACRGFTEVVRILVKFGAKVDLEAKDHSTALHIASFQEDGAVIMTMLLGAFSNLDFVNKVDDRGKSALHLAVESKSSDMKKKVELLLSYGASPRVRTRTGKTPLDFARYLPKNISGKIAVVKLLEEALGPKIEEIPNLPEPPLPAQKPTTPLSTHVAKKVSELIETLKSQKATMSVLQSDSSSDNDEEELSEEKPNKEGSPKEIVLQTQNVTLTPPASPSKLRVNPDSPNWVTVVKKTKGKHKAETPAKTNPTSKGGPSGFGIGKRHYFNKKKAEEPRAPSTLEPQPILVSKSLPSSNSNLPVQPMPSIITKPLSSEPPISISEESGSDKYDGMTDHIGETFPIASELSLTPENIIGMNLKDLSMSQLNELQSMYYALLSKVVDQKVTAAKDLERARCEEGVAIQKDIKSIRLNQ